MTAPKHRLGGSTIAAAVGIDPYVSPLTLSARMQGLISDPPESDAMRLGLLLEPVVGTLAADAGYPMLPAPADLLVHPEHSWAVGHPDGFTTVNDFAAIAEKKTTGEFMRRGLNGEAPVHHQAQVQWYMMLTGLKRAAIFTLIGGQRFEVHELTASEDAQQALLTYGSEFLSLVRRGKLADVDGSKSSSATIRELFPGATQEKVYRLSQAEMDTLHQLQALREQRKVIEGQEAALENTLKLAMRDASSAISPHDTEVIHWRSVQSHRLDGKALKEAHPEIHAEFSTPTTYRRFQPL